MNKITHEQMSKLIENYDAENNSIAGYHYTFDEFFNVIEAKTEEELKQRLGMRYYTSYEYATSAFNEFSNMCSIIIRCYNELSMYEDIAKIKLVWKNVLKIWQIWVTNIENIVPIAWIDMKISFKVRVSGKYDEDKAKHVAKCIVNSRLKTAYKKMRRRNKYSHILAYPNIEINVTNMKKVKNKWVIEGDCTDNLVNTLGVTNKPENFPTRLNDMLNVIRGEGLIIKNYEIF